MLATAFARRKLRAKLRKRAKVAGLFLMRLRSSLSEALAPVLLDSNGPAMEAEDLIIPNVPEADDHLLRFFERPPSHLLGEASRLQPLASTNETKS